MEGSQGQTGGSGTAGASGLDGENVSYLYTVDSA